MGKMKQVMSGKLDSSKDLFRVIPKDKINPSVFSKIKKIVNKKINKLK
jgi:hypothetical protein